MKEKEARADEISIRAAAADDAGLILHFIRELAEYEKAAHEVHATEDDIRRTVFGDDSTTYALIVSIGNTPVGFALYFFNYSTWLGKNGIYLEDLYVSPDHRGSGAGKALLKHIAKVAVAKGCGRFEWSVLDWNTPAIGFYRSIGAKPLNEWIGYRLDGDGLIDFAQS